MRTTSPVRVHAFSGNDVVDRARRRGAIPGARLEVFVGDGASPVLPLERPADFNCLVMSFLGAEAGTERVTERTVA